MSDAGKSMRFGLPWHIKEARETAEAAARRAELSLNEWLHTVAGKQAVGEDFKPQVHERGDDFSRVQLRLDDLARRIEQAARPGPAVYGSTRSRYDTGQIADQLERLERRFHAVASQWPEAPAQHQAPALNAGSLEDRLHRITEQIEMLRRPGVEDAIAALRGELGDIGRALNEALPRHAIETLEMQIQVLAQRIAEGREAGADGRTLAGIENGLAEVRDALHDLMPAENLSGYNEAITALTEKIDLIVAEMNPATMQQLERSIATLREMSAHVASNDTVSGLSAQVQALADKIEGLSGGSRDDVTLGNLESRIDALSRALAERTRVETAMPQYLETLIQTLSERIGELQTSGSTGLAASHLEDRIVGLMQRLDASDSRLNKLDAIERGLADLLVHIEELRANREAAAIRADAPAVGSIAQDIAYTRKSLDSVHRRLGEIFDRFDALEKARDGGPPRPEPSHGDTFDFVAPALIDPAREAAADNTIVLPQDAAPPLAPAVPVIRTSVPTFVPPASRAAVSSPDSAPAITAPADEPLEPGSGPPRRAVSPTLRIAASEAALGGSRPAAGTSASKSTFIAAARRAAQAAQEQGGRAARPEPRKPDRAPAAARSRVAKRAKTALLAASIVAIVAGSFQLLGNVFDFSLFDTIESKLASHFESDPAGTSLEEDDPATVAAIPNDEPESRDGADATPQTEPRPADAIASLLSPQAMPGLTPAPGMTIPSVANPGHRSLLAPPPPSGPPPAAAPTGTEFTGSVMLSPATPPMGQATPPPPPAATDRLPANIGSPRLRSAALGGDAAAAYEIAMRFVEGRGVSANLEEAARWFERAASKGLVPAQFRYASMLEKGQGVKKDMAAAQRLYIAAASKGHAKAMHNLAVLYAEGAEGKPNYTVAAQWFRKAAEHGVADSQYNLGVLTARGLGTERNIAESYKWFALAAAQGDKEAVRKRDDVAALLDARTLEAAQQAVKGFTPAPQPAEATTVTAPPGGWDRTTQRQHDKQRAAGPISLSAFGSEKL